MPIHSWVQPMKAVCGRSQIYLLIIWKVYNDRMDMRINWRIGSYFNISIQRTFDFFEMFLE